MRRLVIPSRDLRLGAAVGAWILGVTFGFAGLVHLFASTEMRADLGYTFGGIPATPAEALAVLAHNTRVLAFVLVWCGIVQISPALHAMIEALGLDRAQSVHSRFASAIVRFGTLAVGVAGFAVLAAINLYAIGAGIGAYGLEMVRSMLPHGLAELGAGALAGALFVRSCETELLDVGTVTRTLTVAVLLLSIGAVLEAFVVI